ncbi:MAG: hypothetical protein ACP5VS_12790, partial [Desulfomonilaceae bacterium]
MIRFKNTLTFDPLPDWMMLLKAAISPPSPGCVLARPWKQKDDLFYWFSNSAWSIVAIVNLWQKLYAKTEPSFWLPGYFCNNSLKPLRSTAANLVFYPITPQLEPNYSACRKISKITPPDIFLLKHYFGQPAIASRAAEFCKHEGAWLIEDADHLTRRSRAVGNHGDFVLYSPHLSLPIPDGALLAVRPNAAGLKRLSEFTKTVFEQTCDAVVKTVPGKSNLPRTWLAKKILQKFGIWSLFSQEFDFSEGSSGKVIPHPQMTDLSRRFLPVVISGLGSVCQERR